MSKILVAEDERDIRDLIAFTLQFAGFEVVLAANGADAVELASRERPDLILLDVRMPKMTGYQTCEVLKSMPEMSSIPIVFLSAKGQESEIQQGLDVGAVDYILKPFAPDDLTRQVQRILEEFGPSSADS
ncbi:MAG TPA: response regulator [Chloroflexi bacterium]|nr:response regulator [Chloroflexota bacterium]